MKTMIRWQPLAALAAILLITSPSEAKFYLGDLVYCDVDKNGVYDTATGDYPLDGVTVDIQCLDTAGQVCAQESVQTGSLANLLPLDVASFLPLCGVPGGATWDPAGDISGRYLAELTGSCFATSPFKRPWVCQVAIDTSTAPVDCDQIVTPVAGGFPVDGNGDGDLCDAEDGPFPEGQPLGNLPSQGGCENYPDALPATEVYYASIENVPSFIGGQDRCSLHNDFGLTPLVVSGPTRTIGFWKNHPGAIEDAITAAGGSISFCGKTYTTDNECEAVAVLQSGGGGLNLFLRQGLGALLNCSFWGCSSGISQIIADGSAACAAANGDFDYGTSGEALDEFNNSGDDLGTNPPNSKIDMKRCAATKKR